MTFQECDLNENAPHHHYTNRVDEQFYLYYDLIKTFENIYKINIKEIDRVKNLKVKTIDKSITHKYIGPLVGIIYSWIYFFQDFKIIYVNYLPLWNPLPFFMLPPKSILGPITGSVFMGKKSFAVNIRNLIFPILYLISSMWIQIRYKKAIFSTNLLKNYFPNNKNYFFNYVITFLQSKKISKKKPKTSSGASLKKKSNNRKSSKKVKKCQSDRLNNHKVF